MAAVSGLGYSLVMISTFSRAQFGALAKGFEENTETYQAISGKKNLSRSIENILKLIISYSVSYG